MTVQTAAATRASPWSTAVALAVAARPKQWIKNGLVAAAPFAAGVLWHARVLAGAAVAVAVFTLAAAGGYLLNDVHDAGHDRLHPDKRQRPVASGVLAPAAAITAGVLLIAASAVTALATDREMLAFLVLVYAALTLAYTTGLKHVPVVELLLVASGFVLRPLAGALATGVRPSGWFLLVCSLTAATIAAGKRQVELQRLGALAASHRRVLASYTPATMRLIRRVTFPLTVVAYGGWALTRPTAHERLFGLISAVPVAVAMLRLGRLNDTDRGDAPEAVLLQDRVVQVAAIGWVVLFVVGLGRG